MIAMKPGSGRFLRVADRKARSAPETAGWMVAGRYDRRDPASPPFAASAENETGGCRQEIPLDAKLADPGMQLIDFVLGELRRGGRDITKNRGHVFGRGAFPAADHRRMDVVERLSWIVATGRGPRRLDGRPSAIQPSSTPRGWLPRPPEL